MREKIPAKRTVSPAGSRISLMFFLVVLFALAWGSRPNSPPGGRDGHRSGDAMAGTATPKKKTLWVIAHRGYSAAYPENTLLAYEKAIEAGADMIEVDVRLSRDGEIVVIHDKNLWRVAERLDRVSDLTLAELKRIRIRGGSGQTIPTAEEVLKLARGRIQVLFDLKAKGEPALVEKIVRIIRRMKMEKEVVLGVRSLGQMTLLRQLSRDIRALGFLGNYDDFPEFFARGGSIARVFEDELDPDIVKSVHRMGKPLWVTAGLEDKGDDVGQIDAERIRRLQKMGIDGVLLNDPALAVSVLRKRTAGPKKAGK